MDNVTTLKPKKSKKDKRIIVTVCWGSTAVMKENTHTAVGERACLIDSESGLLVIETGPDHMICYPIGGVFYWTETPEVSSE